MLQCSLRYEGQAGDLRIMGRITGQKKVKVPEKELHKVFLRDLRDGIVAHINLRGYTHVKSVHSNDYLELLILVID